MRQAARSRFRPLLLLLLLQLISHLLGQATHMQRCRHAIRCRTQLPRQPYGTVCPAGCCSLLLWLLWWRLSLWLTRWRLLLGSACRYGVGPALCTNTHPAAVVASAAGGAGKAARSRKLQGLSSVLGALLVKAAFNVHWMPGSEDRQLAAGCACGLRRHVPRKVAGQTKEGFRGTCCCMCCCPARGAVIFPTNITHHQHSAISPGMSGPLGISFCWSGRSAGMNSGALGVYRGWSSVRYGWMTGDCPGVGTYEGFVHVSSLSGVGLVHVATAGLRTAAAAVVVLRVPEPAQVR